MRRGKFEGDDVRESMVGAVAIRLKDPMFESQTKNKLGNTEIRTELVNQVREELLHFFNRNKEIAEKIIAKVAGHAAAAQGIAGGQEARARTRQGHHDSHSAAQGLQDSFRQEPRAKARARWCSSREGQSAAGSIVSCRDVNTQAIFVLKGKPLNVWDLKRDIVYKNDEMYNLMRSLDIEDNIEGLRYDKVILATDADVDGLHIRNLLITYFFRFFEQLVHDGHLYVLETPLFRVRNKEKTIYCYCEAERDDAAQEARRKPRDHAVQRPGRNFTRANSSNSSAKKCALSQVEYAPKTDAAGILGFYMGKNTPERKDYIMENLVVPVED